MSVDGSHVGAGQDGVEHTATDGPEQTHGAAAGPVGQALGLISEHHPAGGHNGAQHVASRARPVDLLDSQRIFQARRDFHIYINGVIGVIVKVKPLLIVIVAVATITGALIYAVSHTTGSEKAIFVAIVVAFLCFASIFGLGYYWGTLPRRVS